MVVGGGDYAGILLLCYGLRIMSKNPDPCSLKWTEDWCLASLGLSDRDVVDEVGCCLFTLYWRVS